jgi:cell wall-active antibiotic response 4TMS protein YvqF
MRVNRGLVFWGVALVTAGIVALAVQQGYLDRTAVAGAWRLWPLILIAIGISIILARTPFALLGAIVAGLVLGTAGGALISVGPGFAVGCDGPEPASLTTREGTFSGGSASVELHFDCGTLDVHVTDGNGWRVAAGQRGGEDARIQASGSSLSVRSGDRSFVAEGKQRWEVGLGSEVTYSLQVDVNAAETGLDLGGGTFSKVTVDPNAGSIVIDLAGARVDELALSLNAGSASVTVDADSTLAGQLDVNAGSIDLCTSPDTALRIVVEDNITFSHNLDESGLNGSGNTWSTDGFSEASRQVDLRLKGNAASFTLNPEEGCS